MKRITQLEKRIQELKIKNRLKVVGIGNAIVDCLVRVSEDLLDELGLHKGAMTLISNEEVFELENIIKDLKVARASGGSVANTLATLGIFGVHSQFLGKVGDDEFGNFFIRDLAQYRVDFIGKIQINSKTGRSYVFITPDGQRSMATFLGVSKEVGLGELSSLNLANLGMVLVEGYLFDSPSFKASVIDLAKKIKDSDALFILSTSDIFVVKRHIDIFKELFSKNLVDVLFANNEEVFSLTGVNDIDKSVTLLKEQLDHIIVTCGENGCLLYVAEENLEVPTQAIEIPEDTTGAGDSFMGSFLAGLIQGLSPTKAAQLANKVAGYVISQIGARPSAQIKKLLEEFQ